MGVRQWHAWSLDHLRGRTANVSKNWCILPQRVYILGGQLLPSGFSKGIYSYVFLSFFKDFISFIFRERGREGEREGEKHQCVVASHVPPTGDLAHNPGMCPDWEWNRRPFGSQAGAQSTEPHQPGRLCCLYPLT